MGWVSPKKKKERGVEGQKYGKEIPSRLTWSMVTKSIAIDEPNVNLVHATKLEFMANICISFASNFTSYHI